MRQERRGVLYLVNKLQVIQKENNQLKTEMRNRENFNRRLCSENKRRRLTNNQLRRKQNERLLELANLKGYEAEYKRLAENFKKALEQCEEKYEACEDQKVVLSAELTKGKEELTECQLANNKLTKQLALRQSQIERLTILHDEHSMRKKTTAGYEVDYENEIMRLICENQTLEMRLKECERNNQEMHEEKVKAEGKSAALEEELQAFKEIINIMRIQYEQQIKETLKMTPKEPSIEVKEKKIETPTLSVSSSAISTAKPKQNVSLQKYGTRLINKDEDYFSVKYQNLLFSGSILENLNSNPITVHHCGQISLTGNHSWFTRIRLVAEGELNFGLSSSSFDGGVNVMSSRNFIYYNNCSGLIVIDKQGRIIDKYASVNDTLTLTLSVAQESRILRIFKNDIIIYESQLPDKLSKVPTLYPYIKLFQFMSVDIQ